MSVAPARPSLWPLGQDVALQRHHVGSGVGNCAGNRGGAPGRRILRGVLVWRSSAELWVKMPFRPALEPVWPLFFQALSDLSWLFSPYIPPPLAQLILMWQELSCSR